MSLLALIFLVGALGLMALLVYKDFTSPSFLMLIPWFFSLVFLFGSDLYYSSFSMSYLYIAAGLLTFQFFYFFAYKSGLKQTTYAAKREHYVAINNTHHINIITLTIVVIFETITMASYLSSLNVDIENIGGIFEYIHKMVFAVFYLMLIHFYTCTGKEKKRTLKFLVLQLIPVGLALALQSNGRASYFSFIFTVLFIYLTFHRENIIQVLKVLLIALLGLLVLFVYVALRKNHIVMWGTNTDFTVQIVNWITHYASSPIVAFSMWFPYYDDYFSFGTNTLRIFNAILFKMGVAIDVSATIFPFMRVGPGANGISNVYTIYYTYIIDFGLAGGLFIQAILGYFYAKIYKMKDSYKTGFVYLYSISMYSLMMEVFGDQYVAITSGLLQMYLWFFVFYKCQILYASNLRFIRVKSE